MEGHQNAKTRFCFSGYYIFSHNISSGISLKYQSTGYAFIFEKNLRITGKIYEIVSTASYQLI